MGNELFRDVELEINSFQSAEFIFPNLTTSQIGIKRFDFAIGIDELRSKERAESNERGTKIAQTRYTFWQEHCNFHNNSANRFR